jgi:23S rRNA (guanosine2251-2'-O)-methyltransferase
MPGNSQRKGAVRKRGKAAPPAGSGGRVRRGLEGKGPTPKAEDRPYHKAYKEARPGGKAGGKTEGKPSGRLGGQPGGKPGKATPARNRSNLDWVYGRNPVLEALLAGVPVKQALIAEGVERDGRLREILAFAAEHGIPFLTATRQDLDRLTQGGAHQGVALRVPPYEYADPDAVLEAMAAPEGQVAIALDSITDPHNLGAIIRSAAAFGAQGVLIPQRRAAQMNATAWKTSAGAAARIPVAQVKNLNQTIASWQRAGCLVVGLAADAEVPITQVKARADGQPVLLVVGSEGQGLSRLVAQNCDILAAIEIEGMESLNASVAAAIALFALRS